MKFASNVSSRSLRNLLPRFARSRLDLRVAGGRAGRWQRPLGDMNVAMRDLNLNDEQIFQLVEQRALIGFNIAVKSSGRSETRILTHSLEHFRQTRGRTALDISWEEIFRLIFPGTSLPGAQFVLTGLELQQGLNCCRGHVENLAGCHFEIVSKAQRGRGHTPSFKTASVESWLKGRRL